MTAKPHQVLADAAAALAAEVPTYVVEGIADTLATNEFPSYSRRVDRVAETIPHPHYRSLVNDFLRSWERHCPGFGGEMVAAVLLAAAEARRDDDREQVELVWTGPDSGAIPLRRTEQVLLQVIGAATRQVTAVSYAVYNVPRIAEALALAASRGVVVRLILETPDRLEGENAYDTVKAIGGAAVEHCRLYYWPEARRIRAANGRCGALHVKSLCADRRWAFLSSANLTQYAFTQNMELGVLITGGETAGMIEDHFERLIGAMVLMPIVR